MKHDLYAHARREIESRLGKAKVRILSVFPWEDREEDVLFEAVYGKTARYGVAVFRDGRLHRVWLDDPMIAQPK